MSPFLKKKVTAQELGTGLVHLDGRVAESHADTLQKHPGFDANFDTTNVRNEMVFLRIFTFDFAVATSLDNAESKAVLDVHYGLWGKMLNERPDGAAIFTTLKKHLLVYTAAVKTPHHLGPPYAVGKAFAELCGHPMDAVVTLFGGLLFTGTFKCVSDFVKSYRVV